MFAINKKMVMLTNEEAEAFYNSGQFNECPYKYYTPRRKIWWAVIESIPGSEDSLPYTLCQDCFHNNRFGEMEDPNIKNKLVPILTMNVGCNCDGRTTEESFPVQLNDNWKLAVHTLSPTLSLLKSSYSHETNLVRVDTEFEKFDYALCFLCNTIQNVNIELFDSANVSMNVNSYVSKYIDNRCLITINSIGTAFDLKLLQFDKNNNNDNNMIKIKILNIQDYLNNEVLLEFNLLFNYIDTNNTNDITIPNIIISASEKIIYI